MSYGEDYQPVGGYSPEDTIIASGQCSEQCICSALNVGLAEITAALTEIDNTLQELVGKNCEIVDKCKDEIIKLIDDHFRFPTKSCDECKADLEAGLGGTLEYAIACAGACLEETKKKAECDSLSQEGLPCGTCGCEPCTCQNMECVSEDETACEEQPKTKYVGWCNPNTGSIVVTRSDQEPPFGFVQVALGDSEIAVAEEAGRNCYRPSPTFTPAPEVEPISIPQPLCDIQKFYDQSALNILASQEVVANMLNAGATATSKIMALGIDGINIGSAVGIVTGLIKSVTGAPMTALAELGPQVAGLLGCNNTNWTKAFNTLAAIGTASRLIGVDTSQFTTQIQYAMHAGCRQRFLDPESAMKAYLADPTGQFPIDAHWAIAGLCTQSVNDYIQAEKSKPLPLQLAVARRRQYIDEQQYLSGMRQQGYLEPQTSDMLFRLTEQVPTMSEIIHLMVRDADDNDLASSLGLDDFFDQKYREQLKKWSTDQGIPETFARYAWRAHWTIPSPGQLFTFYHRLRNTQEFGPPDKLLKDIKAALVQQDILPHWHSHYLATSFLPMGRIDIRRAFNVGTLAYKDLVPAYQQLGYNDDTCDTLAKFTKRLRDNQLPNHRAIKLWLRGTIDGAEVQKRLSDDGVEPDDINRAMSDAEVQFETSPIAAAFVKGYLDRQTFISRLTDLFVSPSGAEAIADRLTYRRIDILPVKDYIAGAIDRDDCQAEMQTDGIDPDIQAYLLKSADKAIDNAQRIACQRGIKRRYLHGEFDKEAAISNLTNYGTTLDRANKLVGYWECEKASKSKHATAARLCNWMSIGLITQQELVDRLVRLGFTQADAEMIQYECNRNNTLRQFKAAEALQRRQQADQQRQARLIRTVERQAIADANRLAAMRKQKATLRANRDKQLLSAAEKVFTNTGSTLPAAVAAVQAAVDRAKTQFALTVDQALKIVILAAETAGVDTLDKFGEVADTLSQATANDQLEPTDSELSSIV